MRFTDTNVLLYAVSRIPEEAGKRRRALEILTEPDLVVSVQVLQEFYYQATRPTRPIRMSHQEALRFLEPILKFIIQPVTVEIFQRAAEIGNRFHLSYWDSAILAPAQVSGCDAVYSEDLNPGQNYGGLRVINPFVSPAKPESPQNRERTEDH